MLMQKVNDYTENSVQQWTYVHTTINYNCYRRFVISILINLGKNLKLVSECL